jgi:hypothetical protein
MAKVQGPLMSMDASGTYAGTLVFAKWKGRAYVRNRVDPSNPRTQGQQDVRNAMRVLAAAVKFTNLTDQMFPGATETDKALLMAAAPSGQAWNGYLTKLGIGPGSVNYAAIVAAWAAIAAAHAAWTTAAENTLDPPMTATNQVDAEGVPGVAKEAGFTFFALEYALFIGGVHPEPGAVPPVYA